MELWQFFGDLHPKLVQIPLVLLLMGLLFDAAGLISRLRPRHWAAMGLTILGTLGLLFAFICGIYAEVWAGRAGIPQHPIELHELMANIASWGFVILLAWRIFLRPATNAAGASTAKLPRRRLSLVSPPGPHRLSGWPTRLPLRRRRHRCPGRHHPDPLRPQYPGHPANRRKPPLFRVDAPIFGWMTLGLAASLLAQALWPRHARKAQVDRPRLPPRRRHFPLLHGRPATSTPLTDPHQVPRSRSPASQGHRNHHGNCPAASGHVAQGPIPAEPPAGNPQEHKVGQQLQTASP